MDNDLQAINLLAQRLYTSISFSREHPPNWQRLQEIFHERALIVRNLHHQAEYFDLTSFRDWVERSRREGLESFHEKETDHTTHLLNSIAHRASHYQATIGGIGLVEGVNSIQLLRCEGQWRILSLAWEVPGA